MPIVGAHLRRHISCHQHILFPSLECGDAALTFLLLLVPMNGDRLYTLSCHRWAHKAHQAWMMFKELPNLSLTGIL